MKRLKKYRILHFIVMIYLIAAFSWWAILLTNRNKEIYLLKKSLTEINQSFDLAEIQAEFEVAKKMVFGEGLVFAFTILMALLFINRAFYTELKLNQRLSNFLLSVTHELKTPIASLNLIHGTLSKKDLSNDKKKALYGMAVDESRRLDNLVDNILTATKMENHYVYNFEDYDLLVIISNRVERFRKLYKAVDLRIDAKLGHSYIMRMDRESFIKLIDNLIDNAIKYSNQTGRVLLKLKKEKDKILLSVQDQGVGIPNEEKQKVLGKFYRIGDENQRTTKGTGLGLFIVQEVVLAHKGKIEIKDNQPRGTIFQLTFPK